MKDLTEAEKEFVTNVILISIVDGMVFSLKEDNIYIITQKAEKLAKKTLKQIEKQLK